MFLRKLLVIALPLALCFLLIVLFPLISSADIRFFEYVVDGILLGIAMALLIPLMGSRRRETFSRLYIIPTVILLLVIAYQYLQQIGVWKFAALSFLTATGPMTVMLESAFLGFLATVSIRALR